MGTSSSSKGSGSNTPLVPSWLGDEELGLSPSQGDIDAGSGDDQDTPNGNVNIQSGQSIPIRPGRLTGARANFSRFAGSGGRNNSALRRAVGDYVRAGTGGSRNAMRRMGASREAARKVLRIFSDIEHDGIQEVLQRLNLEDLSEGGVQDAFLGLTEFICRDGGRMDEAIARNAWLETVAELDELGIENVDAPPPDQLFIIFQNFIGQTIVALIYQEIGINSLKYIESHSDIDRMDKQLRDYIQRGVQDSFQMEAIDLSDITDQDIDKIVDDTYQDAWEVFLAKGDREE